MLHGRQERGLDNVSRIPSGFGRFGRMFPKLAAARYGANIVEAQALMQAIGSTMIKEDKGEDIVTAEPSDENGGAEGIPAGYTYFGQFIDHDITFDTASDLDRENDPSALMDFRTPRLDLDSIYGRGPDDQPYLYNSDFTLKLGRPVTPRGQTFGSRFDVPRAPMDLSGDSGNEGCARAIIGDPRNDENSIVVQIHALFQRFHNRFVAEIGKPTQNREGIKGRPALATAQRKVRWHYQWLVIHDFLRRVVGKEMLNAVWNCGKPDLQFYSPTEAPYPFMPVEFSVAAYRFGHSMVRPSYSLSAVIPHDPFHQDKLDLHRLPIFTPVLKCDDTDSLNGFRPLIDEWGIDWSFFFAGLPRPAGEVFKDFLLPQPSYRIDTLLVDPLSRLPGRGDDPLERRSLANLNLLRGVALGLPSGQAVARAMRIMPLTDKQLWLDDGNLTDQSQRDRRRKVFTDNKALLHENAPLWYYVLREAELTDQSPVEVGEGDEAKTQMLGGVRLGPVGGRIVSEVMIGLIAADTQSFLKQNPCWKPEIPAASGNPQTLEFADIVRFVDAG
jgi:hypothetical protein